MTTGRQFWCRTLGDLALFANADDESPLLRSAKPLAVLAYVGLAPRARADRDHVAHLIWPDVDLADARHSLRQSLYRLRSAARNTALIDAHGTELLVRSDVEFDWREAERAMPEHGERAYALLRGTFLEGFSIAESNEFEAWMESQRTRFRELRTRVGAVLVAQQLDAGRTEAALEVAEELCALHPFDSAAVRLVMTALAATGRHATAVARYHGFASLLKTELDDEPPNELTAYAQELERFVQSRPARAAAALPLVGRAAEWATLEEAWEGAQRSQGHVFLVEGAAGIGKSRLVGEIRARCIAAKAIVFDAKCYEIERSVPYGAVAGALSRGLESRQLASLDPAWLAEAARVLPELRERFPSLPRAEGEDGSAASKRRLHHALWRCIEVIANERPVLFVIDDLHWADSASLEALHFAAVRLETTKTLFLATYRPAELTPNARQFVRSVCAARSARLVPLEPLSASDIRELVAELGTFDSADLGRAVSAHLHASSGGNPLFLAELLDALARDRSLTVHNGRWVLARSAQIDELPKTLGKLMADRIDALVPWMRSCVEVLAVAADGIPVEVLARALDVSEPRTELALAALEEDHLVRRPGAAIFELVHDELRHLVYLGIPDHRRRLLHSAVGLALEQLGEAKRPGGAARLAFHFDQAEERERAHRYASAAAREASAFAAIDVEQAHRVMADAHAPKALPPGSTARRPRRLTRLARVVGGLAAAGILLTTGVWLGTQRRQPPSGDAAVGDYRQGALYLSSVWPYPTHVLRWPARYGEPGRIEALPAQAASSEHTVTKWIPVGGGTHGKLFRVRGSDSVQITFGESDDLVAARSPDNRLLLVSRGWKASTRHFQQNLFILDSRGTVVRRVTDTPYQDYGAIWSPSGAHIAFFRDSLGTVSLWICDADGTHAENLTEQLGLPPQRLDVRFAPDESRLVVIYSPGSEGYAQVHIVQLRPLASRALRVQAAAPGTSVPMLLWSPDGTWLAYTSFEDGASLLRAAAVNRPEVSSVIARLEHSLLPVAWSDGDVRYVDGVTIEPSVLALRSGYGQRVTASALTEKGTGASTTLRWFVLDTALARVDEGGFVVGRSPGTTRLVASAGGFRADTVDVSVSFAAIDTLFYDGWAAGLDTTRWQLYGKPRPRVVRQSSVGRGPAFVNAGDYNHTSGAMSTSRFGAAPDGITVEVDGWLGFTGTHWQNWSVDLFADTLQPLQAEGPPSGPVAIGLEGPSPTLVGPRLTACDVVAIWGAERLRWLTSQWHRLAIQLRPDGIAECYMDGQLLGTQELPAALKNRRFAIMLAGRMENTVLYHGRVLVTRGLRY